MIIGDLKLMIFEVFKREFREFSLFRKILSLDALGPYGNEAHFQDCEFSTRR